MGTKAKTRGISVYNSFEERYQQNHAKKTEEETKNPTSIYNSFEERYKQNKYYESLDTSGVNDAYIDDFVKQSNSFFEGVNKKSLSYNDATTRLKDLQAKHDAIQGWLYKNKGTLQDVKYKQLSSSFNEFKSSFDSIHDYYSRFGSDDAYNKYLADQEEYEQKWGKYTKESDFEEYAKKGAEIKNPEFKNVDGTSYIFGWRPGYEEPENIVTYSRDNYDKIAAWEADEAPGMVGRSLYMQMNDDEVKLYNYLLAKNGKEAAQEYLDSIEETLNQRLGTTWATNLRAIENPALRTAATGVYGFTAGVDQFSSGARQFFTGEELPTSAAQFGSQYIRQDLADSGKKLGGYLYDATTTIGNMAPSILASTVVTMMGAPAVAGKIVGAATMGMSSSGNAYKQALDAGYDKGVARTYSLFVGAAEAGLQYALGGIGKLGGITDDLLLAKANMIDNALLRVAAKLGANIVSEIGEEELQLWLEPLFSTIILGEEYDAPTINEMVETAIVTALSTGAMEGPSTIGGDVINSVSNKLQYGGIQNNLVAEGVELDNPLAKQYQEILNKDKNLSGHQLDQLVQSNDTAKIQQAAAARMTELGAKENVDAIAAVIAKQAVGENLSKAEQDLIRRNMYAPQVVEELSKGNTAEWAQKIGTRRINAAEYSRLVEAAQIAPETAEATAEAVSPAVAENVQESAQEVETATVADIATVEEGPTVLNTGETAEHVELDETTPVNSVKNGRMVLRLADGRNVAAESITHTSANVARVYDTAQQIAPDAKTANTIVNGFKDSGLSAEAYSRAVNLFHMYGNKGYDVADLLKSGSTAKLSADVRNAVYKAGKIAAGKEVAAKQAAVNAKRVPKGPGKGGRVMFTEGKEVVGGIREYLKSSGKKLTDLQEAGVLAMEKLSAALGTDFYVFESYIKDKKRVYIDPDTGAETTAPNGQYSTKEGKIYVDLNAGSGGKGLMLYTVAHELTHHIAKWSPAKFKILANYVVKEYNKRGQSVDELVAAKIKLYESRDMEIDYDTAFEEVVADSMEGILADGNVLQMVTEIKKQDMSLGEKIVEWFKNLGKELKAIVAQYAGRSPDSAEGQMVASMQDVIGQIEKLYAEALVDAADAYRPITVEETQTLTEAGIGFDEDTQSVYSLRYSTAYKEEIQVGKKTFDTEAIAQIVAKGTGRSIKDARKWVKSEMAIANIVLANPEFLDFDVDNRYEAIKKNSDYPQGTVDLSNLCPKREEFTAMFDMLQKKYPNKLFTAQDIADMRKILAKNDITVACGACFVEDRRQLIGEIADTFIGMWKEAVDTGKPLQKTNAAGNKSELLVTKALAKQYGLTSGAKIMAEDTYIPNQYDLTTYEGFKLLEKNHPIIAMAFNRYNNSRGQQSARLIEGRAEYNRQILGWTDAKVRNVNNNGGLRIFSFSDFEVVHLLDLVQVIIDCSARGVKIQGYTKIPAFAKLVRDTGIKLNRSLIPKGDYGFHMEDGKVVLDYDNVEGINIDDDNFIDESDNPNVGNILIGINPTQIGAAMLDSFVDYIIPFHSNKAKAILKKLGTGEWVNYKESQHEKDIATGTASKHNVNIYTQVINKYHPTNKVEFVEAFLKECKRQGKIPRYAEFLNVDANGDYAYREGYHKLLVDFKMFDKDGNILPQGNITPNLNEGFMKDLLTAEVKKKKDYQFPQEVYDDIEKKFGETADRSLETEKTKNTTNNGGAKLSVRNPRLSEDDLEQYLRTGSTLHTRNKKARMLASGKKPILTTAAEIKKHISDIIYGRASGEVRAFAKVGRRLSEAIKAAYAPLDVEGDYIELNADGLREAYKRHSESKESGDMPLSQNEFEKIPEYLDDFDGVLAVDTFKNRVEVHLYKKIENRFVRILTVSSKERSSLQVTKLIGVSEKKFIAKYGKKIERFTGSLRGQTDNTDASNPSTKAQLTAGDLSKSSILPSNEKSNSKFSLRTSAETMDRAVEQFGTTTDFEEAGFILPSGEMLKFTDDNHRGERQYDHRAIGLVYGVDVNLNVNHGFNEESNELLEEFVESGGIRFDPGSLDLDMDAGMQLSGSKPLTREQERAIRDFIEWKKQREDSYNSSEDGPSLYDGSLALHIDFGANSNFAVSTGAKDLDAWGVKHLSYEGGQINADRIIADIRHYYKTGEIRKPSSIAQFRYSLRDYVAYDSTAILKESKVDEYLADYASKSSPKYAQAYIAYVRPDTFLKLTTEDWLEREHISEDAGELDEEKLSSSRPGIYLRIDHETGEVVGHEGRHRISAMKNAGINRVPVLLLDSSNKMTKTDVEELTLHGQFNKYEIGTVFDAIPLNYENRDRVIQQFATQTSMQRIGERIGHSKTLRFSLRESVEETKDLVAVHNLREDSLLEALDMGGLPMVSIAVMNREQEFTDYGDISIVFRKDTIDPEADNRNRVFGGDGFTPTKSMLDPGLQEGNVSAEEIVEAMKKLGDRGVGLGENVTALAAVAPTEYKSISEIKADKDRLGWHEDENAALETMAASMTQAEELMQELTGGDEETLTNAAYPAMIAAAKQGGSVKTIKSVFKSHGLELSQQQAEDLHRVYTEIGNMRTMYFEAKPERVIGTNEWAVVVVPRDLHPDVREKLDASGANIVEYERGNAKSRLEAINSNPEVLFSLRSGESVSNRSLLANAFEGVAQNDIEKGKIQEYKSKIDTLNAEEQKLQRLNAEIKQLSFAQGARDTARLEKLRDEAQKTANRINTYDRQLLRLEASKPLQSVLEREKAKAYKRAEQKGREALDALRTDMREKSLQKQREITQKYQEQRKKAVAKVRETAEKNDAREKLQKLVLDTAKWISYPTKTDVKCPDVLKAPYAEFLKSIDLSSKRLAAGGDPTKNDLKLTNAMDSLATALDRLMANQDPNQSGEAVVLDAGYLDLPAGFVQRLRKMTEDFKLIMKSSDGYVVNNMTAAEVRQISQLIRTLNHAIKEMSTLYANQRFANVEELGYNSMEYMEGLGEVKNTSDFKNFVTWDNALPYYAFKRFGEAGRAVFEGLMDAQDKLAFLADEIFKFRDRAWKASEAKKWSEDVHTVELPSGGKLKMTTADAMSIYCLSRRPQGRQHLLGGGVRVMGLQKGSKKAQDTRSTLTMEDLAKIISTLTDRQRAVAEAMQEFMSTTCSEWGNEISMKRFLTKEFNEKYYFPIESNDENMPTKDPSAQQSDLFRLLNISATKPIDPRANNELIVRNIFDVFTGHASDMARLNAFGMPLLDYMKWLNYREKTTNDDGQINVRGVRKSMEKAYGNAAKSYVMNLIKDVNGRPSDGGDPTVLMKWMRAAKTASVGSSFRVATLQVTSYPRASLVLSQKSLALGLTKKPNINKAKKYCGIALWKSFGFYDTNISRTLEEQMKGTTDFRQKLIELSLKGAELGDAMTWGALWNACEYEVAATKQYKVGTEEFNKAVGLKLREVVYRTQVVDSTLTRSQIMRSKKGMAQEAAAFMSEPTLSGNILMDAGFEYTAEKRRTGNAKKAWKKTGKIVGSAVAVYTVSALTSALLESLWDAWRDDEDEEYIDKFLKALPENVIMNLAPFNKIPVLSDVFSAAMSMLGIGFYSTDKMSTTWLTQAVDAVATWQKALDEKSSTTVYNALYKSVRAVSSLAGISFSGAMREAVDLWNNTAGAYDSTLKIRKYEPTKDQLGKELYKAITGGDTRQAESLRNKIREKTADEAEYKSYISSAIRKALRENDPRVQQAAAARLAGDMDIYKKLFYEIKNEGNFVFDDIMSAINSEVTALEKAAGGDTSGYEAPDWDNDAVSVYDVEDYFNAAVSGDTVSATQVKNDLIAELKGEGYLTHEAEDNLASSFTSKVKKAYMDGELGKYDAESLLTLYGGKTDGDEASSEIEKWNFEMEQGYSWGARARGYRLGRVSERDLVDAVMAVEGSSREEAYNYIEFLDLEMANDNIDITASDASSYYKYAEPAGISVSVYLNYKERANACEGQKDEYGNTISGTRKAEVLAVIDSLPISSDQKDALYYANNWSKSTINEAPWRRRGR